MEMETQHRSLQKVFSKSRDKVLWINTYTFHKSRFQANSLSVHLEEPEKQENKQTQDKIVIKIRADI